MKRNQQIEILPESFPSDPLSEGLWEALDDLLLSIDNDDAFTVSKLEGYIAGVLCCPVKLKTSEWFPHIWGSGQTTELLGEIRMEAVIRLVLQHYNYVKSCLEDPDAEYEPKYQVDTDGTLLWEIWAEGFEVAMEVGHRGWAKIGRKALRSNMAGETVVTLIGIIDLAMGGDVVPEEDRDEIRIAAPDLIPVLTKSIFELNTRGKIEHAEDFPLDVEGEIPKVGRNEPCPCGSGKKYKKCHGA